MEIVNKYIACAVQNLEAKVEKVEVRLDGSIKNIESKMATKEDLKDLRGDIFKYLGIQAVAIVTLTVLLIQLL